MGPTEFKGGEDCRKLTASEGGLLQYQRVLRGYQVNFIVNLTSSIAVFELYRVKLEDGKKYGIVVEYGPQYTPLTDSVQLQVKSKS